jgi:diacylglycerol kinase (ATP)
MRAAVIFGLGTSQANLRPFKDGSSTEWIDGAPAASSDADAILIFGGDGTLHRHLLELVRLQLPVLVVPVGSGNDFARAMNVRNMREAVKVWRAFESGSGRVQSIDLGTIIMSSDRSTKHYFACVAGCGLDSAVAQRANQMPRWLRGHGGYALSLFSTLFSLPAHPMRFTYFIGEDRRAAEKVTLLAAFANTQTYGHGMRIAPQADPADGKLDICLISTMDPFKVFCMFPTVYFGRHLSIPEVAYSKAERVLVEAETPLDIYADGEYVCQTPVEVGIERGALKIITKAG